MPQRPKQAFLVIYITGYLVDEIDNVKSGL